MSAFLLRIFSMSLQAVLVIGVIFVIRKLFLLMHITKRYVMFLWLIPFFFLVFPWRIPVEGGLWNQISTKLAAEADGARADRTKDGAGSLAGEDSPMGEENDSREQGYSGDGKYAIAGSHREKGNPADEKGNVGDGGQGQTKTGNLTGSRTATDLLFLIWAAGMLVFLMHGAVSYIRLKRKVLCSVRRQGFDSERSAVHTAVYDTDGIQTPIVLGFWKPCIYLPAGIRAEEEFYVTAHEATHIGRRDYLTKAVAYLITCLHWFNPVVWAAYAFMATDMEMACDEETVFRIGMEKRKAYASALLELSAPKSSWFAVPPAFGEGDIRMRIQNIMHLEQSTKKAAIMTITAGILVTGIFLTSGESRAAVPAANTSASGQKEANSQNRSDLLQSGDSSSEEELRFSMVREAFAQHTVAEMDFQQYQNGKRVDFGYDDVLNYLLTFTFPYEKEIYELQISYNKEDDRLTDIDVIRRSDGQMQWIYTVDDEKGALYPNDLQTFLDTKVEIDDWLTLKLPEGYTLGAYQGGVGYCGGALISPKVYQSKIEDSFVPAHWMHAGFVGRVATKDSFVFENGKLNTNYFPHSNHSVELPVGIMKSVSPGSGWTTLLVRGSHDLYTAADLGELDQAGEDLSSLETESHYWYFYFVKEGDANAYVLSLSAKEFSKTKAVSIAKTVRITEDEAARKRKKEVRHTVDQYLQGFLQTMLADSSRVYQRNDFAGMDGYIAAKWLEATREFYKKEYGGIRSVDAEAAKLLQLKENGDSLEALVRVAYTYTWGDHPKTDVSYADDLFRIKLERAGSGWRVADLAIRNCAEIILLEERMDQEAVGMEEVDRYLLVDRYFEQVYETDR